MSKKHLFIALLVFMLVSLGAYDCESRAGVDPNPVRVGEMQKEFRDLWLGHIFLIQHVILYSSANDPAARNAADKQVLANAKQIANAFKPFYGQARTEKLYTMLSDHYGAVKEYSEAAIAGDQPQQEAALARMASNAEDLDVFFNGINPHYLPKGTVRGLIAAHGAHHVLQINQYKKKEYAELEETWSVMRQHVYVIADTLVAAVAKQFPARFP
jgi:hypothetical protein